MAPFRTVIKTTSIGVRRKGDMRSPIETECDSGANVIAWNTLYVGCTPATFRIVETTRLELMEYELKQAARHTLPHSVVPENAGDACFQKTKRLTGSPENERLPSAHFAEPTRDSDKDRIGECVDLKDPGIVRTVRTTGTL